jgi:hypothetical protein
MVIIPHTSSESELGLTKMAEEMLILVEPVATRHGKASGLFKKHAPIWMKRMSDICRDIRNLNSFK